MPLSMLSMTSTPVENGEGSIFTVHPSKRNQSPIVFGRVQPGMSAVTDLGSESEPPQFFHYARLVHHMMWRIGYDLQQANGLNFGRGRCGLLRTFVPKGKSANYYDKTCRGWYITPHAQSQSEGDESLPSHSSSSSEWESNVSVRVVLKNLFINMTSINNWNKRRGYWNIWHWAMGLTIRSPVGEAIWTTWNAHWR